MEGAERLDVYKKKEKKTKQKRNDPFILKKNKKL